MKKFYVLFCSIALLLGDPTRAAFADELGDLSKELQELKQVVQELKDTTIEQKKIIDSLVQERGTASASEKLADPAAASISKSAPKVGQPYIPDIGVIADIVATSSKSKEDEEGNDRVSAREVELVLGHDIDPYARLDATIAFSDFEEASLEEAYASYWDLPGGLKGKVGRFRPKVGKASAMHRDSLDTVDEPLVVQKYFGAEGFSRAGVELNGFLPSFSDSFTQQITGGLIEGGVGEGANLFGESRRQPTLYGHLGNSLELSEETSIDLGGTYLLGSNNISSKFEVSAVGLDLTLSHYLDPIRRIRLQSEFYFQDRNDGEPVATEEGTQQEREPAPASLNEHPWGFYSLADFRLSERWAVGTRYDYVQLVENGDDLREFERGITGYLTFYQSEFARLRAQYQHADLSDGNDDDRFLLQGTFAIGTHKHQIQ